MHELDDFVDEIRQQSVTNDHFVDSPRRIACYAIRCLLSHGLVANNTFADPTNLLKLVGSEMVWTHHFEAIILQRVSTATSGNDTKQKPQASCLPGRTQKSGMLTPRRFPNSSTKRPRRSWAHLKPSWPNSQRRMRKAMA